MPFPAEFICLPDKQALVAAYGQKTPSELPTPSVLIDRGLFTANSNAMLANAANIGAELRVHVKTHKTREGARIQLGSESAHKSSRVVVSTTAEAWHLMPLVTAGVVDDILYGLPLAASKVGELAELAKNVPLRLMVDNIEQLRVLEAHGGSWSVFIKVDVGTHRAGLALESPYLAELIEYAVKSPCVGLFGFYCHAGHSYGSKSMAESQSLLEAEIEHANTAAKIALEMDGSLDLVLSVGATPTAHASQLLTKEKVEKWGLRGRLELHAGNYSCCDLQQVATGCVAEENVAISLLAEVISSYPERKELLINAGCLALSRETGPIEGFGKVKGTNWRVGRVSQEHGILTGGEELGIGERVEIVPQHACIVCGLHPWFFVMEGGRVVDVWVPVRGW